MEELHTRSKDSEGDTGTVRMILGNNIVYLASEREARPVIARYRSEGLVGRPAISGMNLTTNRCLRQVTATTTTWTWIPLFFRNDWEKTIIYVACHDADSF